MIKNGSVIWSSPGLIGAKLDGIQRATTIMLCFVQTIGVVRSYYLYYRGITVFSRHYRHNDMLCFSIAGEMIKFIYISCYNVHDNWMISDCDHRMNWWSAVNLMEIYSLSFLDESETENNDFLPWWCDSLHIELYQKSPLGYHGISTEVQNPTLPPPDLNSQIRN